jgi:hypothetical protein
MEESLPEGAFVLGVDEHTAAVFDVDAGTLTVLGRGGVTIRRRGFASRVFSAGTTAPIASLTDKAVGGSGVGPVVGVAVHNAATPSLGRSPLLEDAARLEAAFSTALAQCSVPAAVTAVLELEQTVVDWSRDTLQSDEPDRVRGQLRSMILRLGELAQAGARDPHELLAPVVELLIAERQRARAAKDFEASDRIRHGLAAAGIELRDTPDGPEWHAAGRETAGPLDGGRW